MDLLKVDGRTASLDMNFSIHMHYISVWNGVSVQDAKQQPGGDCTVFCSWENSLSSLFGSLLYCYKVQVINI